MLHVQQENKCKHKNNGLLLNKENTMFLTVKMINDITKTRLSFTA